MSAFDFLINKKILQLFIKSHTKNEEEDEPLYTEFEEKFYTFLRKKPELRHIINYLFNENYRIILKKYLTIKNKIDFNFKNSFKNVENEKILQTKIKNIDIAIKKYKLKTSNILIFPMHEKKKIIIEELYKFKTPLLYKNYILADTSMQNMDLSLKNYSNITGEQGPILFLNYDPKEINTFSPNKIYLEKFYNDKTDKILIERNTYIHFLGKNNNFYHCYITKTHKPPTKIKIQKTIEKIKTFIMQDMIDNEDLYANIEKFQKIYKLTYFFMILDMLNIGPYNDIKTNSDIKNINFTRYFNSKIIYDYFNIFIDKNTEENLEEFVSLIKKNSRNSLPNEKDLYYLILELIQNGFFKYINFNFDIKDLCIIFDIKSYNSKLCRTDNLEKKELKKKKKYYDELKKNIKKKINIKNYIQIYNFNEF